MLSKLTAVPNQMPNKLVGKLIRERLANLGYVNHEGVTETPKRHRIENCGTENIHVPQKIAFFQNLINNKKTFRRNRTLGNPTNGTQSTRFSKQNNIPKVQIEVEQAYHAESTSKNVILPEICSTYSTPLLNKEPIETIKSHQLFELETANEVSQSHQNLVIIEGEEYEILEYELDDDAFDENVSRAVEEITNNSSCSMFYQFADKIRKVIVFFSKSRNKVSELLFVPTGESENSSSLIFDQKRDQDSSNTVLSQNAYDDIGLPHAENEYNIPSDASSSTGTNINPSAVTVSGWNNVNGDIIGQQTVNNVYIYLEGNGCRRTKKHAGRRGTPEKAKR